MRVGILSESDADEAGIRILTEAVVGVPIEIVPVRTVGRGWTAVKKNLPSVYNALHWRSEAVGLIVVVDSDETAVHERSHEDIGQSHPNCRGCLLQQMLQDLPRRLSARPSGQSLRVAVGLAVPAIEAWYQFGHDDHSVEARFIREDPNALYELWRELKRKTYGVISAPRAILKSRAIEEATRLAKNLDAFERHFPNGFGMLARSLRSWK